jgi:hypothetical protein
MEIKFIGGPRDGKTIPLDSDRVPLMMGVRNDECTTERGIYRLYLEESTEETVAMKWKAGSLL